ncbi:MAG: type IV toxin-antitoxin system AbiEi family antitoxin domain-containing protein [Actinobacteria bacterium]|nr:type IV toxin-antitoxin system AbiEi family antitoxin domain-containing protein [Actinomycetota bacterium]
MKKTILSKKDLEILEEIISRYGYVVSFDGLRALLKDVSYDALKKRIGLLVQRGWLIRIKRGVYAVANLESHSFSNISPLVVSQVLVPNSYVSFEFSLNYYGLFDQLPRKVTAVSTANPKMYNFQNLEYQFVKTKPEMLTGFIQITVDNQQAKVAELEKALLDFLQFRKDSYTVDLILEKLKEANGEINPQKMADYASLYPITIQRRIGFLLDISGIDSSRLFENIKNTPGFAKLTKNSTKFNSKWRLYYEDRFVK